MIAIRELMAGTIFCAGIVGIFFLFGDVFEWSNLLATILCFALAYFIWPSKRKGQRYDDNRIADVFEVLIEFPVDLFLWVFRLVGRFVGGKGDSVDIDF